jgi:riboflavin synthase
MVWIECPPDLARHMVPKGSVAVDGVSLTLVEVSRTGFSIALIPHTVLATTLGWKQPPATVNLETDLLAKYVWKCLTEIRSAGFSPLG